MNKKLREIITIIIAGLFGAVAGFAKVTWAFVYSNPITFLAFDLVIYSLFALVITLINKENKKLMVFVVFLLPSLFIVAQIAIDGIRRASFKNLPTEWIVTPFTIFLAAFIGYKLGTTIKARKRA
jgi:hypothetical protein